MPARIQARSRQSYLAYAGLPATHRSDGLPLPHSRKARRRHGRGAFPLPQYSEGGTLYPPYVRGQAYLALHQGKEAAAQFEKFIEQRTNVANYPLASLARLGLARAYAMSGDGLKARSAYQDFLALWKDADPDVPILKQAKSEYAALH